jgi:pimeloyl-ACP methyl ester carboxylesterase
MMTDVSMFRETYMVPSGELNIAVHATAEPDAHRPIAVLVHGTGYLAQVWSGANSELARTHTIVALDRRGHGLSRQPGDGYDFENFADDLVAVLDYFNIHDALGVGHSAGATDILLGAARRPGAFSRIFVVEPTVMLPDGRAAAREGEREFNGALRMVLERVRRRRSVFADRPDALSFLSKSPWFKGWWEPLVQEFVAHGLEDRENGVHLRCRPAAEAAMLVPVFEVMQQSYARPGIFASLGSVQVPVCVATCTYSEPVYKPMAVAARSLLPRSTKITFRTGHCVAQQDPNVFASAVRWFAEDGK